MPLIGRVHVDIPTVSPLFCPQIWNPVHFDDFVDLSRYVECSNDVNAVLEAPTTTEPTAAAQSGEPASQPLPLSGSEGSHSLTAAGSAGAGQGLASLHSIHSDKVEGPAPDAANNGCTAIEGGSSSPAKDGAREDDSPEKPFRCPSKDRPPGSPSAAPAHHFSKYSYKLVALVEHEGPATEQGHYVCYVKHVGSEAWFRADDKVVEPVDLQRVLAACPYILFYQRVPESSACGKPPLTASTVPEQPWPSAEAGTACQAINPGFAGLREQLDVANGLSQGRWRQWQDLIVGLFKSPKAGPKVGQRMVLAGGTDLELAH